MHRRAGTRSALPVNRFTCGILVFLLSARAASADPSEISNQHPLGMMHLSITPQAAQTEGAGKSELLFSGAISNTVNREEGDFLFDAETREGALRYQYGLTDRLTLSARQAVQYRGGGWTDQPIDEWHKFFGLPRGPRRRVPKDEFHLEATTRDGADFSLAKDGVGLSDLDLQLKYRFWQAEDGDSVLSVAPTVRLPTGESTYGQDSLDGGLTFLGSTRLSSFTLTAGASYIYYFDTELQELRFAENHCGGFTSVEYSFTDSFSGIVEFVAESAMLSNIPRFPDYQTYLDVGLSYRVPHFATAAFYVRENPTPDDSTTDITLYMSIRFEVG